jgi:putative two-component system response regulator
VSPVPIPRAPPGDRTTLPPYHVLHVEDDPIDARLFAMMWGELGEVDGALMHVPSLEAALRALASAPIDLVVLDLDLPDSRGLDSLRSLLACGVDVPVVVLTGHADEEVGLRAVAIGAQDYLVKDDVHAQVLARVVRYAVGRHHVLMAERARVVRAPPEAWDAAAGRLRRALEEEVARRHQGRAQADDAIEQAYEGAIDGWVRVLELRDHATMGHSRAVAELALAIALHLGVPEEERERLRRGALLHDIGKIAVPDAILRKAGPLDPIERSAMERHTEFARDLLEPIAFLRTALDVPVAHHERWDGSGYPQGLAGEEIPLAARIFAVADVYDALTRDRPYRRAWGDAEARAYIERGSGRLFDPAVVAAFLALRT